MKICVNQWRFLHQGDNTGNNYTSNSWASLNPLINLSRAMASSLRLVG